ncbi:hypothetical protein [Streptomyces spiralis]|uniref:hypothetical protein n=1 Tax=Streptomyces spiralis TaxID=66376 RepID=UPI003F4D666B
MRGIGHLGTGNLEVRIASAADLEKAGPLIRRAFETTQEEGRLVQLLDAPAAL